MGDVWLSQDENLGAQVVTKMVAPGATADQVALLRQECRSARRLSHPNIVRVFDFHEDPSATFITMEYVAGGDISQLRGRQLREIVAQLLPLVGALEYAHGEGVVHRDLKSSNVLVDPAGRLRLSDFGIAGVLEPDSEDLILSGGGTRHHASPQQVAGQPASPADDIYSLGVLVSELLNSSSPLPEPLQTLLHTMMASRAEDRPSDMTAVREALERLLDLEMEEGTEPPQVVRDEIRLSPPPRVSQVRTQEPLETPVGAGSDGNPSTSRHPYWGLTVTAFLALAAVTFGVFVVLPKWVEKRGATPMVEPEMEIPEPSRIVTEIEVEPLPVVEEAPSQERVSEPSVEVSEPPTPAVLPEKNLAPSPPRVDPKARAFAESMTAGLRAFESGEMEAAKAAFERALSLQPDSAQATDGLARSELAMRLAQIRQHQIRAEELERQEAWHEAGSEYTAALALDSTLRFAREGKDRSAARAALNDQLDYHIAYPKRLSEDSVLKEARESLAAAAAIEPSTQKLRRQIEGLQNAINIATTPVEVLIVSDNFTSILVYRVGRLGTFERRTLELRPGSYTVVGTREGYRDVRHRLEVMAKGENKPLTVRCEEKI